MADAYFNNADAVEVTSNVNEEWQTRFNDGTGKVSSATFMVLDKPEFRFYTESITEQKGYDYNQAGVTAR